MTAARNAGLVALLVGAGVAGYFTAMAHADTGRGLDGQAAQPPGGLPGAALPGAPAPAGWPPVPPPGFGLPHQVGMGGPAGHPPFPGMPPLSPSSVLAGMLSAEEVAIGIRADQLDAWRDYTDALQALMVPPGPPAAQSGTAFGVASAFAERAQAQGKKAQVVMAALEKLKVKLTAEQLERAKVFEAHLPPPPLPPRFGPGGPPGLPPGGTGTPG